MSILVATKPALVSQLLRDNHRLQECLKIPRQHVVPGSQGEHVGLIQQALMRLGVAVIGPGEISAKRFGDDTLKGVRRFKGPPRNIINLTYQHAPDDIVGQMTIEPLDNEMDALEKRPAPSEEELVCSTDFGAPHDHSRCPPPSSNAEIENGPDGTMSHMGTPLHPLGFGKMVNIGGAHEADYLGFEGFVPDPRLDKNFPSSWVNGRRLTSALADHSVSDILFRSTPIDAFMQQGEIRRIAMRDARLTIVGRAATDHDIINFVRGLGIIVSTGAVWDEYSKVGRKKDRAFLVAQILVV
jgi:hypothetical protein